MYTLYLFVNINLFEWIVQLAYRSLYIYIVPKKNLRIYIIKVGVDSSTFFLNKKEEVGESRFRYNNDPLKLRFHSFHRKYIFFTEI